MFPYLILPTSINILIAPFQWKVLKYNVTFKCINGNIYECFSRLLTDNQSSNNDESLPDSSTVQQYFQIVNRGKLSKPSDSLYILVIHCYEYFSFIKQRDIIWQKLLSFNHPRDIFIETFLWFLNQSEGTYELLNSKCLSLHKFLFFYELIARACFNLFAKNFVSEENSQIHFERKRGNKADKKDPVARKCAKLSSVKNFD